MYACFLLTGHGSLNGYLYERNLNESARCACCADGENWRHVLVECRMNENLRALSGCGGRVTVDGSVNVERVIECKEMYKCFCKYGMSVFVRRRMNGR